MAVRWRKAFLSESGPESGTTRAVLLFLSTEMRADGSKCFPSYATIGAALMIHPRTVATHVKAAEAEGWLEVVQRSGGRGGRFNQYFPRLPRVLVQDLHDESEGKAGETGLPSNEEPQRVGGGPTPPGPLADRVGAELHRVGPACKRVGPDDNRVGGGPTDLDSTGLLPGSSKDLERQEVSHEAIATSVPDDFEPGDLADVGTLYAAMTAADHRWAAGVLERETDFPIRNAVDVSRPWELAELPPARLRELQYTVATRNGAGAR